MNDNDTLRELVVKWREHAALYKCERETDVAVTLERCADELDAALAAQQQGGRADG